MTLEEAYVTKIIGTQKKEFLTTVKETVTLEEALKVLEDSGFRCVPILTKAVRFSAVIFIRCTSTATSPKAAT